VRLFFRPSLYGAPAALTQSPVFTSSLSFAPFLSLSLPFFSYMEDQREDYLRHCSFFVSHESLIYPLHNFNPIARGQEVKHFLRTFFSCGRFHLRVLFFPSVSILSIKDSFVVCRWALFFSHFAFETRPISSLPRALLLRVFARVFFFQRRFSGRLPLTMFFLLEDRLFSPRFP